MQISQKRRLNGRTARPVEVTPIGMGGVALGNLYKAISSGDAFETMSAALRSNIGYFDTAPLYGFGLSEQRMGRALANCDVTLSTKVGRLLVECPPDQATPGPFVGAPPRLTLLDYSYDGIMRSYEASLERLGRQPDILLIHAVDSSDREAFERHVRDLLVGGGHRALSELRAAGEIAAIGASASDWRICEWLLSEGDFDCFLLAGRYTLLDQEALDSCLPRCLARDVGVLVGCPFNSGILATGASAGARYDYAVASPEVLERTRRLERICAAHNTPLCAAALQFALGHPAVRSVLPSMQTAAEVKANIAMFERRIPAGLWFDLCSEGLLRPDAPLPGESAAA